MGDDSSQDFSSRRHFHWTKKVSSNEADDEETSPLPHQKSTPNPNPNDDGDDKKKKTRAESTAPHPPAGSRKKMAVAASRLRSVLIAFARNRLPSPPQGQLGARVVGTLFGHRRGRVHFAFQRDSGSPPAFLVELATPISGLVREMASGLVRIALECDKEKGQRQQQQRALLEERRWRTYCNGKKCGFAARRECGGWEGKVLRAVELISMGAGVLPPEKQGEGEGEGEGEEGEGEGEVMYMRAKFERVVGSRDSEAFYMMNPDSHGAPELSVYLLRV